MRRCPSCHATNPDGAAWCNQCYARLGGDASPGREPARDRRAAGPPREALATPREGRPAVGLRRRGDRVEWLCPACDAANDLERDRCDACGTPFTAALTDPEAGPPPDWRRARLLSLLAPGAGHVAVGSYGSGVARLALFSLWLVGGVVLAGAGPALFVAGPLLAAAAVLWAGSLVDLGRLERGQPERLDGRGLLWLVVGVLGATVVGALAGAASLGAT